MQYATNAYMYSNEGSYGSGVRKTYSNYQPTAHDERSRLEFPVRNQAAKELLTAVSPYKQKNAASLHNPKRHTKARFRMLKRLKDNHDGEGAKAADPDSVDWAVAFVDHFSFIYPVLATLDDDGCAVIELHSKDAGLFADITFSHTGEVSCYLRIVGQPSEAHIGPIRDIATRTFFEKLGVR